MLYKSPNTAVCYLIHDGQKLFQHSSYIANSQMHYFPIYNLIMLFGKITLMF